MGAERCVSLNRSVKLRTVVVRAVITRESFSGEFLDDFMPKGYGEHEDKMKVAREIRRIVEFKRLNLCVEAYQIPGAFDAIFCRNVPIYFDMISKRKVLERLLRISRFIFHRACRKFA